MAHIDTCVDVDLEWSPSTNTLPIRRLARSPISLPTGRFTADLAVDADAMVLVNWKGVATSGGLG